MIRGRRKLWAIFLPFALLLFLFHLFAPPQHVPWKPLDMEASIGLATGTKITLITLAPSRVCLDKLASANHLTFNMAEPKNEGGKCGWVVATSMQSIGNIKFRSGDVTQQCPLMLASYIWLLDVDKAAQKHFGSPLKSVHHAGTYSCRRQVGNSSGAWSEHAFANAWDVTGFALENGQVISVLKDWHGKTTKAKFLKDARNAACRVFRVVLSPDFNAAHKNHFHLDQGPSLSCR